MRVQCNYTIFTEAVAMRKLTKYLLAFLSVATLATTATACDAITDIFQKDTATATLETLQYQKIKDKDEYRVVGLGTISSLEVTIPSTYKGLPVTEISNNAFSYSTNGACEYLEKIIIPDSVTTIGENAFRNCSSLTSVVIGNGVTTIGEWAFDFCSSLTSVVIGNSVTTIEGGAFRNCSSLTEIVIPDSVTTIGTWAFQYCSSLTEIVIPDSVTTIERYVFEYCSRLTIYCEAESEPSGWAEDWNKSNRPVVWGYTEE